MIRITDINSDEIKYYKSLRFTPLAHTERRIFVAEGKKIVLKLLNSKLKVESVFCVEEFARNNYNLIKSKGIEDNKILIAGKSIMNEIVGYHIHSGVMAIGEQPDEPDLGEIELPCVMLNNIVNAENVGAIIRNCAAFGIRAIICDKPSASPYLRRCVRVSMGNIFDLQALRPDKLLQAIELLKKRGARIIAAENTDTAIAINKFRFPERAAVVFGNEGEGIDGDILAQCDSVVKIPICESVPSINVAASSAIFLYSMVHLTDY